MSLQSAGGGPSSRWAQSRYDIYLFLLTAAMMNPIKGEVNNEMKMMSPLLSPCSSA